MAREPSGKVAQYWGHPALVLHVRSGRAVEILMSIPTPVPSIRPQMSRPAERASRAARVVPRGDVVRRDHFLSVSTHPGVEASHTPFAPRHGAVGEPRPTHPSN